MTPKKRKNINRLFNPRHIAIIGGKDAEVVIGECVRIGFTGSIWPVNPKRETIAGIKCFKSIEHLPDVPDATYIAIPREAAISVVKTLSEIDAGGAVCYTAGFNEVGSEGAKLEKALIKAAGDLALVGPNCYGIINYINKLALWPFAHGGSSPGYGAAVITQSGMLSSDLTMSQRSLPFAYMISAGNQSILKLEDYIDFLSDLSEVRAIGLHIEGLSNIGNFTKSCLKAMKAKIPIVALKTGGSKIGARLTSSHTASLSGDNDLYQALFERLGIISVSNPAQLIETLKFICIVGIPKGNRIAGLTCSGGGATMIADHSEKVGLILNKPSKKTKKILTELLPHTATVSNPLDYTTPIWGIPKLVQPVFDAFFSDPADVGVLVQDYPLPGLDESVPFYRNDAQAFISAIKKTQIPGAVCSTLPENLDQKTREILIANKIAPMQGLDAALNSIAGTVWYNQRCKKIKANRVEPSPIFATSNSIKLINEWEGKQWLKKMGIGIPKGYLTTASKASDIANKVGFPVTIKLVDENISHKTEAGAVALNLTSVKEVEKAIKKIKLDFQQYFSKSPPNCFLIEQHISPVVAELLINIYIDKNFGLVMTLASGGILADLISDKKIILLPATRRDLNDALMQLKVYKLLSGYRGKASVNITKVIDTLAKLAQQIMQLAATIQEIEINPLIIQKERNYAVDVLMYITSKEITTTPNAS